MEERKRFLLNKEELEQRDKKPYQETKRLLLLQNSLLTFYKFFMGIQAGIHIFLLFSIILQEYQDIRDLAKFLLRREQMEIVIFLISLTLSGFLAKTHQKMFKIQQEDENCLANTQLYKKNRWKMIAILVCLFSSYLVLLVRHYYVVEYSEGLAESDFQQNQGARPMLFLYFQLGISILPIISWVLLIFLKKANN